MKRFFTLFALGPGAAFAHGAHPPVPDGVHEVSHIAPMLGAALVVVVTLFVLRQRFLS